MIRIKDYIFNENEIVKIQFDGGSKEMEIDHKNGNRTFIDGTFDDIEWNYGEKENTDLITLKDYVRENWGEDFNKNTTLKKMIDRIILRYNCVEEDLQNEVDNYKDCIKEKYELEEENKKLKAEVDLLNNNRHFMNNKIGEAVEYIKGNCYLLKSGNYTDLDKDDVVEVIKILEKGE